MQLSPTFLSLQDGKPYEPIAAGQLQTSHLPLSLLHLSVASLHFKDMQSSEHPKKSVGFWDGW